MGIPQRLGTIPLAIFTDASNNIGIGGSPSGSYKFEVTGTGNFTSSLTSTEGIFSSGGVDGSLGAVVRISSTNTNGNARNWALVNTYESYGDLNFRISTAQGGNALTAGTTIMTLNRSGNVGIGTSNPQMPLSVQANTGNGAIRLIGTSNASSNNAGIYWYDSNDSTFNGYLGNFSASFDIYNQRSTPMAFYTAGTERMRITSGGVLYVGASSIANSGTIMNVISTNNTDALSRFYLNAASSQSRPAIRVDKYDNTSTTAQVFIDFTINQQTAGNGSITANGASQATFTTWSDARLKENITDLPSQLSNIMALRPVEFDYKDGTGHQIGFIAQEVQEVYPDIVNENAEGYLTISGLSKTESRLIKALQEAVNKIEQLSAKVSALENK
jgi:hypothetical protein